MSTKLFLFLISILFASCDGVSYFCLTKLPSESNSCRYKDFYLEDSSSIAVTRFAGSKKNKIIFNNKENINEKLFSISVNNKRVEEFEVQKEITTRGYFYVLSSFRLHRGDTVMFRYQLGSANSLCSFILGEEKLFLD